MANVGWIGTGVMGLAMAGHLQKAGHTLVIYSRTKEKAQSLLDMGAVWAATPQEVAEKSSIVFSMVGFPHDVEEVILGEQGVLKGMQKGGILCDMTTSAPDLAQRIAHEAAQKGCQSVDAPVTGGDVGAQKATLSIFVGGDATAHATLLPYFECMGKAILYCGAAGFGQKAKLANQVAIAGAMFSVCEAMLFAQEAGLDVRQWIESVIPGSGGSVAMNVSGRRILEGDFEPGFYVEHFLKDLTLCMDECRRMQLILPGLAAAEQAYRMLVAQGYGKKGTQVLIKALAHLSAKEWLSKNC